MQTVKRRGCVRRGGIIYLPPEDIETGCVQTREHFDDADILELKRSIAEYGILNPLTVRLRDNRCELIAGERRLRAARLLELAEVPCLLLDVSLEEASLIALAENLQRCELDTVESARALRRLNELFGMNTEEIARRTGKPQSYVSDRLRLLKLTPDVLDAMRTGGLGVRHGKALLRLPDAVTRRAALGYITAHGLSEREAEEYIDSLLGDMTAAKRVFIMKDLRIFENSVLHGLELMRQSGIGASLSREDSDDKLVLHITIPKKGE